MPRTPEAGSDPAQLLRRARGNEEAALGKLLERYRNYLELLARLQIGRRLQGKVDGSDLVQETFLEAHRHFSRFQGSTEATFAAWLRQILAARLAKMVRRYTGTKGRDVRLERSLLDELEESSRALDRGFQAPQPSPSEHAARREQAVLLVDGLGRLPDDYREVLILRHLEALPFPAVARRMGRSVDSVKKLWARALPRLREALGEEAV